MPLPSRVEDRSKEILRCELLGQDLPPYWISRSITIRHAYADNQLVCCMCFHVSAFVPLIRCSSWQDGQWRKENEESPAWW